MKFHVCRAAVRGVAATVLAAIGAEAGAAQLYVQPSVYMREEMDDNATLEVDSEQSLVGSTAGVDMKLGARDELWHIDLDAGVYTNKYDREAFDYDGQHVKLIGSYANEMDQFDLSSSLMRDSTRESEVLDTGNLGTAAMRREMADFAGSWRHFVSPRQLVEVAPSATKTRYDPGAGLNDYDQKMLSLGWIFLLSERSRLTGSMYQEKIEYLVDHGATSETGGLQLKIDHEFSETQKIGAYVGRATTDTDGETDVGLYDWRFIDPPGAQPPGVYYVKVAPWYEPYSSSKNTTRLGVDYEWAGDRTSGTVSLSQNTRASGDGYIMQYQALQTELRYNLTDRQFLRGTFMVQNQKALDDQRYPIDRDLYEFNLFYVFLLAEEWTLDLNYRYRIEKIKTDGVDADSNAILFGIRYTPTEWTWGW